LNCILFKKDNINDLKSGSSNENLQENNNIENIKVEIKKNTTTISTLLIMVNLSVRLFNFSINSVKIFFMLSLLIIETMTKDNPPFNCFCSNVNLKYWLSN